MVNQEDDSKEESWVRVCILPTNERGLKKLRTRRRRIRSESGGVENIRKIAVTACRWERSSILGMKLDVVLHARPKLASTESYVEDELLQQFPQLTVGAHVLVAVLRLRLQSVPVEIYLDGRQFSADGLAKELGQAKGYAQWFRLLESEFQSVEWFYPKSGGNLSLMERKMEGNLDSHGGEHVVEGSIEKFVNRTAEVMERERDSPYRDGEP